jgi:CRP/FNR family cyclic AMP-dependent transcriptional regulator
VKVHETLATVDLFAGMPQTVLDELVARGSTRKVGPGTVLVQQGNTDSGLHLILEGDATVIVHGVERATLGAGDYFGEISLIDSAPRSATVVAGAEGTRVFGISPLAFGDVLDTHPEMVRPLLRALTARLRRVEAAHAAATAAASE